MTENYHQHQISAAQTKYQELKWRLNFLRTRGLEPDPKPSNEQLLDWFNRLPQPHAITLEPVQAAKPKSLNQYFSNLFPSHYAQFGDAFLELPHQDSLGGLELVPVAINHDFFGSALSDPGLGLDIIYFEPEMQWYYREPILNIYKPTSPEKLQALFRALVLRSANILKTTNAKLKLWDEFRSDKTARTVVQRAKSILAADSSFFSPTSPHQRIKGQELVERVARVFVDQLLTAEPGQILRLQQAYTTFLEMLKDRNLPAVDKKQFKAVVAPLVRDQFQVALRNDLPALDGEGLRGWKGIKIQSVPALN